MLFSCSVNESRCKPVCVCVFVSIGVVRAATKQHSGWGLQGYRQPWHLKCCDSTILTGAGPHLLSSLLHHQLISQWKPPQLSEWKIRGWSWSGESHHACVYCKKKKITVLTPHSKITVFHSVTALCFLPLQRRCWWKRAGSSRSCILRALQFIFIVKCLLWVDLVEQPCHPKSAVLLSNTPSV